MTATEQRIAIARVCGYEIIGRHDQYDPPVGVAPGLQVVKHNVKPLPDYLTDLNALAAARDHLINTPELRIRWVNTLRDVVGRTCTRRNKLGKPLVSDIDLLFATPEQLAETLVLTLKLKPATDV